MKKNLLQIFGGIITCFFINNFGVLFWYYIFVGDKIFKYNMILTSISYIIILGLLGLLVLFAFYKICEYKLKDCLNFFIAFMITSVLIIYYFHTVMFRAMMGI